MPSDDTPDQNDDKRPQKSVRRLLGGLSAKLLILTVVFIMVAEVLVFVPSVANFRKNWLMERLAAAQIAALATLPEKEVPKNIADELLRNARVHGVALKRDNTRSLILQSDFQPGNIVGHYDLRDAPWSDLVVDALGVYFAPKGKFMRVVGQPGFGAGDFIEIVVEQDPLKAAMVRFGLSILGLSIVISLITGALVYIALNVLLVRPMTRLTHSMVRFGEDPEDPSRVILPSSRQDEIGTAERELASMQEDLASALQQKNRLAALGLAVSKINHDLRNILSTAQLISDRLGGVKDPLVQRITPRLVDSLDRAIRLCADTLKFGKAEEAEPVRLHHPLCPLVTEVVQSLGVTDEHGIDCNITIDPGLNAEIDRDQVYRVLSNLCRNAVEALKSQPAQHEQLITVTASRSGTVVTVDVSDNGPGVPERARAHLFEAFQGSARAGGTGLGLAIAAELVRAHGGEILLAEDGEGTTFRFTLPDQVVELGRARLGAAQSRQSDAS